MLLVWAWAEPQDHPAKASTRDGRNGRKVRLTFTIDRHSDRYCSHCPELGVSSCGSTEEEALANVLDACGCWVATCQDLGNAREELEKRRVF